MEAQVSQGMTTPIRMGVKLHGNLTIYYNMIDTNGMLSEALLNSTQACCALQLLGSFLVPASTSASVWC